MINVNLKIENYNGKPVDKKLVKLWMNVFGVPYMEAVRIASLSDEDYKKILRGMIEQ